jgi:hypothetical protein
MAWTPSTGGNLYAVIDEVSADDADYVTSAASPSQDSMTVQLTPLDEPQAGTTTLHIRAQTV